MKLNFTLLILFFWTSSQAQNLEEKIADKLCECFQSLNPTESNDLVLANYENECLKKFLNIREILGGDSTKVIDTLGANANYDQGYQFGHQLGIKSQASMVKRCDAFFRFMDDLRSGIFKTVNISNESANISSKTTLISIDPTVENYYSRGLSYFVLKNFKMAKKDFDGAIAIDDKYFAAYLLRGFLHEQTKNYKKAIADYQQAKKLSGKIEVDVFIAIAERKKDND